MLKASRPVEHVQCIPVKYSLRMTKPNNYWKKYAIIVVGLSIKWPIYESWHPCLSYTSFEPSNVPLSSNRCLIGPIYCLAISHWL